VLCPHVPVPFPLFSYCNLSVEISSIKTQIEKLTKMADKTCTSFKNKSPKKRNIYLVFSAVGIALIRKCSAIVWRKVDIYFLKT